MGKVKRKSSLPSGKEGILVVFRTKPWTTWMRAPPVSARCLFCLVPPASASQGGGGGGGDNSSGEGLITFFFFSRVRLILGLPLSLWFFFLPSFLWAEWWREDPCATGE